MSKHDFEGKQSILDLLKYTMDDILMNPTFQNLQSELEIMTNISNPIDLLEMKKKAEDQLYDSFVEFIVDAERIWHNIKILGRISLASLCDIAKNLVAYCRAQVENIEKGCAECYENQHKHTKMWQLMVCSKPHIVLWTRGLNCRKYWPVKLISLVNGDQFKVIRFDGDNSDFVNISAENCYLYSREAPAYDKFNVESVLKEVKAYTTNAGKKFGAFRLAKKGTRFYGNRLTKHMKSMYPKYIDTSSDDQDPPSPQCQDENTGSSEMDSDETYSTSSFSDESNSNDDYDSASGDESYSPDSSENDNAIGVESKNTVRKPRKSAPKRKSTAQKKVLTNANGDNVSVETDIDLEIPLKKQRVSSKNSDDVVERYIEHDHQYGMTVANDSGFVESSSPSIVESPPRVAASFVQELVHSFHSEMAQMSQTMETSATHFEKIVEVKFAALQNDLKTSQEKYAAYESMIQDLNDKIQALTSEVVREREEAEQALTNAAIVHANEMAKLKESHEQAMAEKEVIQNEQQKPDESNDYDCLKDELQELSEHVKNITAKHEDVLARMRNDHAVDMEDMNHLREETQNENQTVIEQLQAKIQAMTAENMNAKNAVAKTNEEMKRLKEKHKKSLKKVRANLEVGHQKMMKELKEKMEEEQQAWLDAIREQHQKDLEEETKCAIDDFKSKFKALFIENE
ncbi:centrosomal protein of 131 kDa-like [Contarinia nasturtii]|uniref:centrosomal protein of 131 kDa-like n=1 Tax=Contarinia nasturtii TaxID=265458 RepID=UPI0012D438E0|nr:centrosomal protein of 131 kDa-like [Contarinia nasturtii]